MNDDEMILNPSPARLIEGLRDTGYDFNTAMADLVDNSIAANASIINVKIDMDTQDNIHVYIADNGCGMDFDGLKNAMRYGSAERDDPNSLGKFGLGLKTASTTFCRSLSVLSKGDNNEYNKVQWDLDEIVSTNSWKLLQPELDDDEIEYLEETTNGNNGTLVIWDKVDRLIKKTDYKKTVAKANALTKYINNLKFHFSMVYQRFLDPNYPGTNHIKLYVNGEEIRVIIKSCGLAKIA